MDHKEFLAGLTAEQRLALTAKSDRPGLVHLAQHWGAIAGVTALIIAGVPGWQLLLPVQGILLVFLFTLLHETAHRTPFASEWINVWVGRVCGFVIMLPPEWFRLFHMAHHRFTNDPARDPELGFKKPETWRDYLLHICGLPILKSHLVTLIDCARGRLEAPYLPASAHPRIRHEARVMIALYLCVILAGVASGSVWLIWVWVVPILLGQPFLRVYLMAEHGRCPSVANMFENTRTTFTTHLVRWLAWNMPYHAEHHAFPTVPFHRLPAIHALANPHLKVTERGYWRFHRGYHSWLGRQGGSPVE